MTEQLPDFKKHCRMEFGGYAQVHEENTPTNTTEKPRIVGAICLGSTGNLQGGYYFMNLATGRAITRHKFTPLPMPTKAV